jgi:hypothetical protein
MIILRNILVEALDYSNVTFHNLLNFSLIIIIKPFLLSSYFKVMTVCLLDK